MRHPDLETLFFEGIPRRGEAFSSRAIYVHADGIFLGKLVEVKQRAESCKLCRLIANPSAWVSRKGYPPEFSETRVHPIGRFAPFYDVRPIMPNNKETVASSTNVFALLTNPIDDGPIKWAALDLRIEKKFPEVLSHPKLSRSRLIPEITDYGWLRNMIDGRRKNHCCQRQQSNDTINIKGLGTLLEA